MSLSVKMGVSVVFCFSALLLDIPNAGEVKFWAGSTGLNPNKPVPTVVAAAVAQIGLSKDSIEGIDGASLAF